MTLLGNSIVAGTEVIGDAGRLTPRAAATGVALDPEYSLLSLSQLEQATAAAAEAALIYRDWAPEQRGELLERLADDIDLDGAEIIARAGVESGLPEGRLTGELARTLRQLRLFAGVARQGDHLGVRVHPADEERKPSRRPDLRTRMVPLGPVAVFGASNFPLAFSTAGGDTASALAAGCPVVVKAHDAHPGTAELVARSINRAIAAVGAPAGVFSLVYGVGTEVGRALVTDPQITAVAFTGSRGGGLALVRAAASRPVPIPVFAEMSSVNPVFILPGAISDADRIAALAARYVGSLTTGAGQLCTNPGLVFVPQGQEGDQFVAAAGKAVAASQGSLMLTTGIAQAFERGTQRLKSHAGVEVVAEGAAGEGIGAPGPLLTQVVDESAFAVVAEEVFGSSSTVVRYRTVGDLVARIHEIDGQLSAAIQAIDDPRDREIAAELIPALEPKVGRILFNGWPTGVEVSPAMVHGGPFPATSDSRTTSVGTLAVERFQRPVCYQDVPAELLPPAVRDDNPWHLVRRVGGDLQLP